MKIAVFNATSVDTNQTQRSGSTLFDDVALMGCYANEGPAKSFVTGFGLLQCYFLSNIFYYKPSKYSPFTETHFCKLFTQSRKADK